METISAQEFQKRYGKQAVSSFRAGDTVSGEEFNAMNSVVSEPTATAKAPTSFGQKVLNAGTSVANFFGAKGISEQFGADIARATVPKEQKDFVEYPKMKEVVGSAIQTGANFIPGAGVGSGLLGKVAVGAGTGYTLDVGSKLQQDQANPFMPGIGTVVGAALPVVGAGVGYAKRVVGRLFKGLGSGVSGVSTKTLDEIINNPHVSDRATQKLAANGNNSILEENARQVVGGVAKIKQEARQSFGRGVQSLKAEDVDPTKFRGAIQPVLDKFGSKQVGKFRALQNVEFSKPADLKKASGLIDRLSTTKLDGYSLRKLMNDVEKSAYKTTGSDAERLSYNAFTNELSDGIKSAITGSTGKLNEINKAFSSDMQLAEATEKIFGKVNYKNVTEVATAAKKLEGLFSQKGLDPKTVDDFLTRIGVSPSDFRATEAVRQITNKEVMPPNTPGFNFGEIMRTTTGSIMTPETIRNLTIKTGLAKEKLTPLLTGMKGLSPTLQKTLIQALLQSRE